MRVRFALLLLLLSFASCKREPSTATPELTYRSFNEALQRGQSKQAWKLLSASTQERAQAKSKQLVEASKGMVRDEPEILLFQGSRPAPISDITQVRADEASATLSVTSAGTTREVKLVKDSGKWLVDLSDTL